MARNTVAAVGRKAAIHAGGGASLVVGLLTVAIGLASFALWFQWRQTRRCLDFFGSQTAGLIQGGSRVEVWERRSTQEGVADAGAGPPVRTAFRYDVTGARGLVHLRRGLVEDANFDWDRLDDRSPPSDSWDLALAFFEPSNARQPGAVLLIDRFRDDSSADGPLLEVLGQPGRVGLGRLAAGIEQWWLAVREQAPRVEDGMP